MGRILNRNSEERQRRAYWGISSPLDLVPLRSSSRAKVPYVSNDTAFKNSAVWAAIRLRADLISTMPLSGYTMANIDGSLRRVDASLTPFMASPKFMEWRYSSQVELDRSGNSIGIITDKYANTNYPANIDLVPSSSCTVFQRDGVLKYRINRVEYDAEDIWHEKQFTVAGSPVGMSPVAYAAFTLGNYVTIQDFASDWFTSGATPRARLKNTAKKLNSKEAAIVKEAWRAAQASGDLFVHGNDWEYDLVQTEVATAYWMDSVKLTLEDASRFFGVPADLIDAQMNSPNITYANITQRNLQFLILNLGPAILRRENAFSGGLLPRPRMVEFGTNELLRMDPMSRAQWIREQIDSRTLAPNEARAMDNRPPFTEEQITEFDRLGLNRRNSTPGTSLAPIPVTQDILDAVNEDVTGIKGETSPLIIAPPPVEPATGQSQGNSPNESSGNN